MQVRNRHLSFFLSLYEREPSDTLDLSNGDLVLSDIQDVIKFIKENPQIKHLNLSCNYLGPEAAKLLAYHLSLETLDISNNLLCDTGAAFIAEMPGLQTLNIANNHLTDHASPALFARFQPIDITLKMKRSDELHLIHNEQKPGLHDALGNIIAELSNDDVTHDYNESSSMVKRNAVGNIIETVITYSTPKEAARRDKTLARYDAEIDYMELAISKAEKDYMDNPKKLFEVLTNFKQQNNIKAYIMSRHDKPKQLTCQNYLTAETQRVKTASEAFCALATDNRKKVPSLVNSCLMFFNRHARYSREFIPSELKKQLIDEPGANPKP